MTPQSQKEIEGKDEEERSEIYTKTHSDVRSHLRKDMAQNIVRLDEGEEEESEVTQEAQAGMGGGGRNWENREDRRRMRRRWRKLGRGEGRKGKGMRFKGRG